MRALCLLFSLTIPIFAQFRGPGEETLSSDLDSALARGLSYLARQQQADGSFLNREKGDEKSAPRFGGQKVILSSACLLAYLSTGQIPELGKHGLVVRNAIDFLVKAVPEDGYLGKVDSSQMSGHALATLALIECYGIESDPARRKKQRAAINKAIKVLLRSQHLQEGDPGRGGWRTEPQGGQLSLITTSWCILALHAARNAGSEIPLEPFERARGFAQSCWRTKQKGFSNDGGDTITPASNAAGLLCLLLLGQTNRQEITAAAAWLRDHPVEEQTENPVLSRQLVLLAAFHAGGETWRSTWERYQSKLLQSQQKDGSWPSSRGAKEPGQTYSSATSILCLSMSLWLLPAFQR